MVGLGSDLPQGVSTSCIFQCGLDIYFRQYPEFFRSQGFLYFGHRFIEASPDHRPEMAESDPACNPSVTQSGL